MSERWYKEAVIYCVEVETFQDSDGDGCGDLRGPDQPAGLPRPARRHLPVAQPDPPDARPRRRLRRQPTSTASTRGWARLGDFVELAAQARRARHPGPARPGRQPHLRPAPVVPVAPAATRTRRTATGTSGATTEPPDRRRASSSPASRPRPGPGTTRPGLVLPPLLRLPARPELVQPRGPRGDQEGHGLLAAARRLRLPDRRRAVRPRAGRARRRPGARRTSRSSTTGARTCSGARGDAVLLCEANVDADDIPQYCTAVDRAARTTARTCCSPSCSTRCCGSRWPGADAEPLDRGAAARCPRCRPWRSGRRSCATTTSSTSAGSPASSATTCSRAFAPKQRHAALRPRHPPPAGADAGRRPRRGSSWPTRCSSRCRARRSSGTARRSAWARTCRCRAATRSARRCSGSPSRTAGFSTAAARGRSCRPVTAAAPFGPRRGQRRATSSATPTRCCAGSSR